MNIKILFNTITGKILGSIEGDIPFVGENEDILISNYHPDKETQTIVNGEVVNVPPVKPYNELRVEQYRSQISSDAFQEAYFEKHYENDSTKMDALQATREQIKLDIPKG